jgi:hypothetical protein
MPSVYILQVFVADRTRRVYGINNEGIITGWGVAMFRAGSDSTKTNHGYDKDLMIKKINAITK